jgi:septum site-determining protein MinC
MLQKLHHITIKGTKEGLIFVLDDTCSFDELLKELKEKLSSGHHHLSDGPSMSVKLKTGNRYLSQEQRQTIRNIIVNEKSLVVDDIESNVISKEEAEEMMKEKQITSVVRMVRSGQVLEVKGDLLLAGDVNPTATVRATGNIFVMGVLRGIAHAGYEGDENAVVAASIMQPSQLRIADVASRASDDYPESGNEMECAYIGNEEKKITIDRIQLLYQLRPNLTRL